MRRAKCPVRAFPTPPDRDDREVAENLGAARGSTVTTRLSRNADEAAGLYEGSAFLTDLTLGKNWE